MEIQIADLSFSYSSQKVLESCDLDIRSGERLAVIGPSGCGKSTLLKLLLGIVQPNHGSIVTKFEDPALPLYSAQLSESVLFPWKTVLENLELIGPTTEAVSHLKQLDLGQSFDYYPRALSAGMRQRAILARMVMLKANAWLLDEPFNGLDVKTKGIAQNFLRSHQDSKTIVFVTHNLQEVLDFADRAVLWDPEEHKPGLISEKKENWESELRDHYFDAILQGGVQC